MTRLDLLDATGLANNGRFSLILKELEQCDFIRSYIPFGKAKKDMMYQLIDPFCLFYFKFMHNKGSFLDNYWVKMQTTPEYDSWCGHAFEIVIRKSRKPHRGAPYFTKRASPGSVSPVEE